MRKFFYLGITIACVTLLMTACKKDERSNKSNDHYQTGEVVIDAVTDYDGNSYNGVWIGNKLWMKENLSTTHFADGTPISYSQGPESSTIPLRVAPGGNEDNVNVYGYLYNWPAVMCGASSSNNNPSGIQGICPFGWHVPSEAEWIELENIVSSDSHFHCDNCEDCIAKALAATTNWLVSLEICTPGYNPSANNATGFSALPAGYSAGYNDAFSFGEKAVFWSATQYDNATYCAHSYSINNENAKLRKGQSEKFITFSVRCVRD